MLKYKVLYTSCTGNTEKLATAIYQSLTEKKKDIEKLSFDTPADDAEVYLVGFWTDKGSCQPETQEFLKKMNGKKVLLFGTCGFGGNQEYFAQIEKRVMEYLPPDCEYLGCYLCQGKMMMSVRTRYEQMLQNRQKKVMAEKMIENFDRALLHPDAEDLVRATEFVRRVCK